MKKKISLILYCYVFAFTTGLYSQDFIDAFNISTNGADEAFGLSLDQEGNVYLSGNFEGTADFDPGPGEAFLTAMDNYDAFLAKYDAERNFIWAFNIAGASWIYGRGVATDGSGNVYLAGYFLGEADFDPSEDEFLLSTESTGGYLAKYDTDGNFLWAFSLSAANPTVCYDVCLDNDENVWLSGNFYDPIDLDPSEGEFYLYGHGSMDGFMAKYSPSMEFIWAGEIGGEFSIIGLPVLECDTEGNLYYGCIYENEADLDPGTGEQWVTSNGSSEISLVKLDASGSFQWGFSMGGEYQDLVRAICFSNGQIVISGFHEAMIDFDPSEGEDIHTSEGDYDAFLAAYTPSGDFAWALTLPGTDPSQGMSLASDNNHNLYLGGSFYGTTDFDPSDDVYELSAGTNWDCFTAKYNSTGDFQWVIHAGGNGHDYGQGIAVSTNQEEVMVAGKFQGMAQFDFDGTGFSMSAGGVFDGFLATYTTPFTVGVDDVIDDAMPVEIFPNPADEWVTVKTGTNVREPIMIQIISMDGRLVATVEREFAGEGDHNIPVHVGRLDAGSYVFNVRVGSESYRLPVTVR